MPVDERDDDFAVRRQRLAGLDDDALHRRFWELALRIVSPLVDEAREHTTPAIERSVLLRMGFTGAEAKTLVEGMQARGLLGHGAGRLLTLHARRRGTSVREAGLAVLGEGSWGELVP